MPRITLVSPFAKFHGKSAAQGEPGGQVLFSVGSALYSRRLVSPANPDSAHQTSIRALMTTAANGYQGLTDVQAQQWRTAAAGLTRTNILGQSYRLTGMSLYMLVNLYRLMDGQALVATPGSTELPGAITGVTSVTVSGGNVEVVLTHSLAASEFVYCRLTQDLGGASRQARKNDYRTITTDFEDSIVARAASPQTLTLSMDYFTLTAAQHVGVSLLPLSAAYYPGTVFNETNIVVS